MLYHVTLNIDHQALGFDGQRGRVSAAEAERAKEIQAEGRLIGVWRRADTGGAIFIVDCGSHEEFTELLMSLPLFPYLRSVEVTALLPHPAFPEYADAGVQPGS